VGKCDADSLAADLTEELDEELRGAFFLRFSPFN
jgi:hypothetical protein